MFQRGRYTTNQKPTIIHVCKDTFQLSEFGGPTWDLWARPWSFIATRGCMAASYILPRGRMCDSAGARYRRGNGPVSCVVYVRYMWKMYNVYTCEFLNIYIYIDTLYIHIYIYIWMYIMFWLKVCILCEACHGFGTLSTCWHALWRNPNLSVARQTLIPRCPSFQLQ
jgi:hypothetical protein